jgi:hypothetical protein
MNGMKAIVNAEAAKYPNRPRMLSGLPMGVKYPSYARIENIFNPIKREELERNVALAENEKRRANAAETLAGMKRKRTNTNNTEGTPMTAVASVNTTASNPRVSKGGKRKTKRTKKTKAKAKATRRR